MDAAIERSRPAGRYGPARRRLTPRGWAAVVAAVVAVGVVLSAWWAVATADPVTWRDVSYKVVDAASTQVAFEVAMDPGTTAVCTVRALSASFGEVGLVDLPVGPSARRSSVWTVTVPTSELAVTGTVKECVVSGG